MTRDCQIFAQAFSDPAKTVFLAMIREFQEGYMAYVYQTSNPDTQKRRLRQLDKTFRRLLDQPGFYVQALSSERLDLAQAGLGSSFYDFTNLSSYLELLVNGAFAGFCKIRSGESCLELELVLSVEQVNPAWVQGLLIALEHHIRANYDEKQLRLSLPYLEPSLYQACGYELVAVKETGLLVEKDLTSS